MKKLSEITGQAKKDLIQKNQNRQSNQSLMVLNDRSETILRLFTDAKNFAEEYNYSNCIAMFYDAKTNSEALKDESYKLRELKFAFGIKNTLNWISAWILTIGSLMDFSINEQQARTTSALLYEELYMVNIAEFTLFFKNVLKGKYGDFYGKFNLQLLLKGAREFRHKRGAELSKLSSEEQKKLI